MPQEWCEEPAGAGQRGWADQPWSVALVLQFGGQRTLLYSGHLLADRDWWPCAHKFAGCDPNETRFCCKFAVVYFVLMLWTCFYWCLYKIACVRHFVWVEQGKYLCTKFQVCNKILLSKKKVYVSILKSINTNFRFYRPRENEFPLLSFICYI